MTRDPLRENSARVLERPAAQYRGTPPGPRARARLAGDARLAPRVDRHSGVGWGRVKVQRDHTAVLVRYFIRLDRTANATSSRHSSGAPGGVPCARPSAGSLATCEWSPCVR